MTDAERKEIYDRVTAETTERLRAILTSDNASTLDDLANFIAFRTAVPADEALTILSLTRKAIENVQAKLGEPATWARATSAPNASIHSH